MSLRKRTSRVLESAELRSAGLKAIDANLDLGDAYNLKSLTQLIEQLRTKIEAHNTALSTIDSFKVEIEELEQILGNFSEKMLMGIGFKYGKDSREYEMAGGVRKSERIRKSRSTRLKSAAQKAFSQSAQNS
ncbi:MULTISPECIES: hypothetical protein [Nostoc]|uniref:ATPase involved in DNA repair n=2 Tax=Nostoc TaxID=1177 RepID=A0ABR8IC38_9NOSO|nr:MULTISPECIES: hypothetical protein [Nostoc]MBD2563995.1 hypothetical protein [Nostoc linckia FACHB-391]MBD2648030.1 hypothetical protein [Nostoc foliaceum FACHB-393]